jgi:hypothetical protein
VERIIGIDPSNQECGIVVLDNGQIIRAFNVKTELFYSKVTEFLIHRNFVVVFEDLRPYTTRLTQQVIDTAKFIGEAVYRLKCEVGAKIDLIPRNEVKKWCFDAFPHVCLPIIDKTIERKDYRNKDGVFRKASFVYCNDSVIQKCMMEKYKIPLPKAGKGYQHGLKSHNWQALATATCFLAQRDGI